MKDVVACVTAYHGYSERRACAVDTPATLDPAQAAPAQSAHGHAPADA